MGANVVIQKSLQKQFANSSEVINSIITNLNFSNYVITVSHSDYLNAIGGTEKVIHAERDLFKEKRISYIQFYPVTTSDINDDRESFDPIVGVNIDFTPVGYLSIEQLGLILKLLKDVRSAQAVAFHIHHLKDIDPLAISYLIKMLGIEDVKFFIHDYYTMCAQVNLLFNNKEFCGGPAIDSDLCKRCQWGRERKKHIERINELFNVSKVKFIAPSLCAKEIWLRSYESFSKQVEVIPHQVLTYSQKQPGLENDEKPIRVAYIGYQAENKGWNTWIKLVRKFDRKNYELFHVGAACDHFHNVKQVSVSFIKDGQNAVVDKLRELRIDIAFLWSICPETYSFTVFESFAAGSFVITNNLSGNIANQVRKTANGMVFETEEEMFAFLKDIPNVRKTLATYHAKQSSIDLTPNPAIANATNPILPDTVVTQLNYSFSNEENLEILGLLEQKTLENKQIVKLINSLKETRMMIDYLQNEHHAKDVYIESLFRSRKIIIVLLKVFINRFPRLKKLLKEGIIFIRERNFWFIKKKRS